MKAAAGRKSKADLKPSQLQTPQLPQSDTTPERRPASKRLRSKAGSDRDSIRSKTGIGGGADCVRGAGYEDATRNANRQGVARLQGAGQRFRTVASKLEQAAAESEGNGEDCSAPAKPLTVEELLASETDTETPEPPQRTDVKKRPATLWPSSPIDRHTTVAMRESPPSPGSQVSLPYHQYLTLLCFGIEHHSAECDEIVIEVRK